MRRMRFLLIFFVVFSVMGVPSLVAAQNGLIPCDGPECQLCHVVSLASKVIEWIVNIMVAIIALVFAIGGFKMLMSGGSSGQVSSAKTMMTNSVVGFVILMAAYLIIDTILKEMLTDQAYGTWNEVKCTPPPPPAAPTPTPPGPPAPPPVTTGCATQCAVIPSGITVKAEACAGTNPCTVSSEISTQLTTMDGNLDGAGINWQITEAFPPTRAHSNNCHYRGTCIDANFTGGTSPTPANVAAFISQAGASGMRAVYEVKTQADKDALVSGGVPAGNIQVLGNWISAPHFSVYKGGG